MKPDPTSIFMVRKSTFPCNPKAKGSARSYGPACLGKKMAKAILRANNPIPKYHQTKKVFLVRFLAKRHSIDKTNNTTSPAQLDRPTTAWSITCQPFQIQRRARARPKQNTTNRPPGPMGKEP